MTQAQWILCGAATGLLVGSVVRLRLEAAAERWIDHTCLLASASKSYGEWWDQQHKHRPWYVRLNAWMESHHV